MPKFQWTIVLPSEWRFKDNSFSEYLIFYPFCPNREALQKEIPRPHFWNSGIKTRKPTFRDRQRTEKSTTEIVVYSPTWSRIDHKQSLFPIRFRLKIPSIQSRCSNRVLILPVFIKYGWFRIRFPFSKYTLLSNRCWFVSIRFPITKIERWSYDPITVGDRVEI